MMTANFDAPVLIIGAGPTGMTAALELAYHGVPSIILDEGHELSEGSRAIAIHRTALMVWEKLGCVEPMLEKGIAWQVRRTFFREQELYAQLMPAPAPGALPTFINLQQYYTELYLLQRIQGEPLIDLRWDHQVVNVVQDEESVILTVVTPTGPRSVRGRHALACDGARSSVRKLLQLDFPGHTHKDRFLIADIRARLPFAHEPRFFFDHPTNPGYTVLIHPQPDGVWRMDWQLGAEVDIAVERSPEKMDRRIRALIGETPYELVWLSDYRFHQRLLSNLRHGRIFFAGDAAHLVSPFGARGMNSAIQDVENLGWKLAWVLAGQAPEALLDTYHAERWPAQYHNQVVTDTTMRFMAPRTPWQKLKRNVILRLSARWKTARKWVNSGKMSEPFTYTRSPILIPDEAPAQAWQGAPRLGAKAPDGVCGLIDKSVPAGTRPMELRRLFGAGFVALYFAPNVSGARAFVAEALSTECAAPLTLCPVLYGELEAMPSQLHLSDEASVRGLWDFTGALTRAFGARPGSLFLIRPDGHVAARRRTVHGAAVARLVRQACAWPVKAEHAQR